MSDVNMEQIIENGIKAARDTITTCDLIITRMVDQYVMALDDGSVLKQGGRIAPFGKQIGDVERTRDRKAIDAFLANVKAGNPNNSTVQTLRVMSWKEAARRQRAVAEDVLARFEELKAAT